MTTPVSLQSVLLVISSAPLRSMYAEYLIWRGVGVREVPSAALALDQLAASRPDVVVLEDRLTDSSGLRLARTIRHYPGASRVPLILLSSDVFGMNAEQARQSGCDLLLTIPCLPEALFSSLAALLDDPAVSSGTSDPDSWLFLRDRESVRIMRTGPSAVTVCGPGHDRQVHSCASPMELASFQVDYEERLIGEGYALDLVGSERRVGTDRRAAARGTDRRRRSNDAADLV